jgi:3,4-dihydroxy-2-butanone 4-phosphate synthase
VTRHVRPPPHGGHELHYESRHAWARLHLGDDPTRHTEAAFDLARLAGLKPVGVLSGIVNDDGTLARGSQLTAFAARHDLVMISIGQLIAYRRRQGALT